MKTKHKPNLLAAALVGVVAFTTTLARAADPLPAWNDGAAKKAITDFVAKVTAPGSPDFVPVPERIATFDNDGTLWCEKPLPAQLFFALDRVKELAPSHPEWKTNEPFASLLKGDLKAALAGGGARFCLFVHHDDAAREFAYDRKDALARLDKGLDEAAAKGWMVVSMKDDWKQIFPFEK